MAKYDYVRLRESLIDYFSAAVSNGNPIAQISLIETRSADDERLLEIARDNGYDLTYFEIN